MNKCTWKGCEATQVVEERQDKHNRTWVRLCPAHALELSAAVDSSDPRALLRAWVLASGGAKKLASTM